MLTRQLSRAVCVALTSVAISSCGFPPEPGAPAGAATLELRGFPDTLLRSDRSGFNGFKRLVIRDSTAWLGFWDTLTAHVTPKPPTPAIDFSTDMVIAVALSRGNVIPPPDPELSVATAESALSEANTDYSIRIDGVQAFEGDVWIHVLERKPSQTCGRLQLHTPVAAVRVARFDGRTTFIERGQTIVC